MSEKCEVMEFLCQEPRSAGSPRNRVVKNYLIQQYEDMGYKVEIQNASFTGWALHFPPEIEFLEPEYLKIDFQEQPWMPVVWSPPTRGVVEGFLVHDGEIKTFETYPWNRYAIRSEALTAAYLLSNTQMVWAQPLDDESERVPHLMVGPHEGQKIEEWRRENTPIRVRVSLSCDFLPDQELSNIIASSAKDAPVIICSHYDSMYNTVGAHDNASGTAALLGIARAVRQTDISARVRLISFDAEEYNKLGAYKYVRAQRNQSRLDEIQLVINMDSVGVGDSFYVLTAPEIEDVVRDVVQVSSSAPNVKQVVSREKFGQFDSWPFMRTGNIPVMQIGSTYTDDNQRFRWWHHPKDALDNIDYSLIDQAIELVLNLIKEYPRIVAEWNAKR
jgi:hypothetical protein